MTIFNRGKKLLSMIVVVSFCFLIFQAAPMAANSSNSKKVVKKADVGVIEQQADWDQPVKKAKKKSILPWIIGGLVVVGGVVLVVLLTGDKTDPRGEWKIALEHPTQGTTLISFNIILTGGDRTSGTWTLKQYSDIGTWTLDGSNITIRATYIAGQSSNFVLKGTVDDNRMEGTYDWPNVLIGGVPITGANWTADRISGPPEKVKRVSAGSVEKAVKK